MFTAAGKSAAASAANYIEDVFSTYLYTGNSSTQTITNGIDLSGKGGMVFVKSRSAAYSGRITDTARGATNVLYPTGTGAQSTESGITSFSSSGFALGSAIGQNESGTTFASWTFRKQAKFFDVVTYTGNGTSQNIAHNLGSTPGTVIVKSTSSAVGWYVWHRSLSNTAQSYLILNTTAAETTSTAVWNNTAPTSTQFSVGATSATNGNGVTYVAYLFAHDAGGFGASGTDNVISCGSYTGNGSATGPVINLGYEPQWVLVKNATSAGYNWYITDTMRGFTVTTDSYLAANLSDAELTTFNLIDPTPTGFAIKDTNANYNQSGATYIYIAIRRGPMRTPTSGTSVFSPSTASGVIQSGFVTDSLFPIVKAGASYSPAIYDRLRGETPYLVTSSTATEAIGASIGFATNNGVTYSFPAGYLNYFFRRAPGFFDVVCYTGTGVARTVNHNLGVVPELMIVKSRSNVYNWAVYSAALGNTKNLWLNTVNAEQTNNLWNNTTPTSSVFSVGTLGQTNLSSGTFVAYLFATLAGVSKVGSYTGTGTTKQIDCGFAAGARFVMIKRTDNDGDWYVWDSARGIVAGNDPYLLLNSTAAEVTNTDYVDTYSAGFEISSTAPAAINANGGTFIFLAIA